MRASHAACERLQEEKKKITTQHDVATTEYILPLADPRATLETVGGKGASLARLAAAGLPVPGGFHITTAAYRRFVAENGLQPRHSARVGDGWTRPNPRRWRLASRSIQRPVCRGADARWNRRSHRRRTRRCPAGHPAVAVRSSATAEDLPEPVLRRAAGDLPQHPGHAGRAARR